ncbi:MAG: UvrD-helicase domain-containing protein [Clostridia bacterium]|nr:UvrD-helicase domain-containing protein [Clostridia bacterium]
MSHLSQRYIQLKKRVFEREFAHLNPQQQQAVFTVDGPLLVLAGAGSGKTTVLIERIGFLLQYGNAYFDDRLPAGFTETEMETMEACFAGDDWRRLLPQFALPTPRPYEVLAITFTNKAAAEIGQRLEAKLPEQAHEIVSGTFHRFCVKILRRTASLLGYGSDFTIYDTDDTKRLITECLKALSLDPKQYAPRAVLSEISNAKNEMLGPDELAKKGVGNFRTEKIADVYRLYQQRLLQNNAMDFDDLIWNTVRILQEFPDRADYYRRRFRYVMIDEYQDTNTAQDLLVHLLTSHYRNLCVVGDDDQSIYRFRGATVENILGFDQIFCDAKVIRLERNYRSTSQILDAANAVIRNNVGRKGKELWTEKKDGVPVHLQTAEDDRAEALYVCSQIQNLAILEKRPFSDFAVLYRTNKQSLSFESTFARSGLPYRIFGGHRFYDRKEIKDLTSYLSVIHNGGDAVRLKRIINLPKRGIGEASVEKAQKLAEYLQIPLFEVCRNATTYPGLGASAAKLAAFAALIDDLRRTLEEVGLNGIVDAIVEKTGYAAYLKETEDNWQDKLQNIEELASSMTAYATEHEEATLGGFLEDAALVSDLDDYNAQAETVTLMTVHAAKGLEFPCVFVVGMEDGLFPSGAALLEREELEEERRLAYVAMTRAKERLELTYAKRRMIHGQTMFSPISRFVTEIPDELLDKPEEESPFRPQTSFGGYTSRTSYSNRSASSPHHLTAAKPTPKPMGMGAGPASKPKADVSGFLVGGRVKHPTFGEGTLLKKTEMGGDVLMEIAFDTVGTKRLMANYARITKCE